MSIISKFGLTLFEILNELYITAGAGFIGLVFLIEEGIKTSTFFRNLLVASVSASSLFYVLQVSENVQPSRRLIVFISGCDSGLGFSLAQYVADLGFTVFGGFLSLDSPGAKEIAGMRHLEQIQLDISKRESLQATVRKVEDFLREHPKYELFAVINNAAVMVFAEFEWQTDRLIHEQININLIGTMRMAKYFCPLLRKHKGRFINITSHCAEACLPGLSVYGATKAAVNAFSDGLRVEMAKYGVKVVKFIPGSFVMSSQIMAKHSEHVEEMRRSLSRDQWAFYGDYFERYNDYLALITPPNKPKVIEDEELYKNFGDALTSAEPKTYYKVEPFRYALYHILFKVSPAWLRDYFVEKFMMMPQYEAEDNQLDFEM